MLVIRKWKIQRKFILKIILRTFQLESLIWVHLNKFFRISRQTSKFIFKKNSHHSFHGCRGVHFFWSLVWSQSSPSLNRSRSPNSQLLISCDAWSKSRETARRLRPVCPTWGWSMHTRSGNFEFEPASNNIILSSLITRCPSCWILQYLFIYLKLYSKSYIKMNFSITVYPLVINSK